MQVDGHLVAVLWLCLAALVAGLTDSVVGGGGLVQVPALFIVLPDRLQAELLGTNKFSMIFGTSAASVTYARRVVINWRIALTSALVALPFSSLGALSVAKLHPIIFKPIMLVVLIAMAGFTFARKNLGEQSKELPNNSVLVAAAIGAVMGFYDGFFGPGTGSLLIFLFVTVVGMDFLNASATAKVVNFATNFGAVIYFLIARDVLFDFSIPMAITNLAGGMLGSRLAIKYGNSFIRLFFQVIIVVVIGRYAWDILHAVK